MGAHNPNLGIIEKQRICKYVELALLLWQRNGHSSAALPVSFQYPKVERLGSWGGAQPLNHFFVLSHVWELSEPLGVHLIHISFWVTQRFSSQCSRIVGLPSELLPQKHFSHAQAFLARIQNKAFLLCLQEWMSIPRTSTAYTWS